MAIPESLQEKYHAVFDAHLAERPIVDSSGAFLQSELELIDPVLHYPLNITTFAEDISPRKGYTIDDEILSWTNSVYGTNGFASATGKSWLGMDAQDVGEVNVNIRKAFNQTGIWAHAASWTFIELSKSQKLQRPIDVDKLTALQIIWNQDVDNQAYLGDTTKGLFGLANADQTTVTAAGSSIDWAVQNINAAVTGSWASNYAASPTTAANLILNDLRALDNSIYNTSGWTKPATKFLIPSSVWSILNVPLAIAGVPVAMSIREYFEKQASIAASMGQPIKLVPRKWLNANSVIPGNTYGNGLSSNRVVGYSEDEDCVRFEYTPLLHTPVEVRGLRQQVIYYGGLGGVEILRPGTVGYITNV